MKSRPNECSSMEIRNMFLNYFIEEHNHKFIRSSPVRPFCDPTVPFVNAGMNQVCAACVPMSLFLVVIFINTLISSSKTFSSAKQHLHAIQPLTHKNVSEPVVNIMI